MRVAAARPDSELTRVPGASPEVGIQCFGGPHPGVTLRREAQTDCTEADVSSQ